MRKGLVCNSHPIIILILTFFVGIVSTNVFFGKIEAASKLNCATPVASKKIHVVVTPDAGKLTPSESMQFIAVVEGSPNQGVRWEIIGGDKDGSSLGSISPSGLFRAPSRAPLTGFLSVKATSVVDGSSSNTALIAISDTVEVNPSHAVVLTGDNVRFGTLVNNSRSHRVRWFVNGVLGGNSDIGLISSEGKYTAPASIPSKPIRVTAVYDRNYRAVGNADLTIRDSSIELAHQRWLERLGTTADTFGCTDISIKQQAGETVRDIISIFDLKASEGSCLVLLPISGDPNFLRYSLAWGGRTIGGKDLYYISDVGKMRIWNGVPAAD